MREKIAGLAALGYAAGLILGVLLIDEHRRRQVRERFAVIVHTPTAKNVPERER